MQIKFKFVDCEMLHSDDYIHRADYLAMSVPNVYPA